MSSSQFLHSKGNSHQGENTAIGMGNLQSIYLIRGESPEYVRNFNNSKAKRLIT